MKVTKKVVKAQVNGKTQKTVKAAKVASNITYRNNEQCYAAFLFNCRKNDLLAAKGSTLAQGVIVAGQHGFVRTVCKVDNCKAARTVSYKANALIDWQGKQYKAMVHADGSNYCVAETKGNGGKQVLFNTELDRFAGQTKKNRATLVKFTGAQVK